MTSTVAPSATASATATRTIPASPATSPTTRPSDTATASATPTASPTATPTPTVEPGLACAALGGRSIGGADIRSASLVAAGANSGEYCRVSGTIAPQLDFEVRLPTAWNGRALFTGGGGLNGFVLPPEFIFFLPNRASDGYVTIATDSGHRGSPNDGTWALGDPLAVENFAHLAIHTVLGAAREIIQARYGTPPRRSYFIGMSTGGREGLIAAQRYPADFDGIVSLEPVYDMTALILAGNRVARQVFTVPGGHIPPQQVESLARATLEACDDLDGLADGIISHVSACRFDPAVLRCSGPAKGACLTDEQIRTVNTVHSPLELSFELANGIRSYPAWPVGHENGPGGWATWVTGTSATADRSSSLAFTLSDQTLRYLVAGDPSIDTLEISLETYAKELATFSALIDATDPDLTDFAARGGKLILWHGLADYGVSAYSTIRYYERVVATHGEEAVAGFLRFYTSPGVDHLNGGPGAGTVDYLGALIAWVEDGTAPGDLVAHEVVAGNTVFTRPLCRHPAYPRYDGEGDPSAAASFRCAMP